MPTLPKKTLKVVPAPLIEPVPRALPVLEMPKQSLTVEFTCGNCGAVLIRGEEDKSLSSRCPLQLLRRIQFDGRLTPFKPCYRSWIGQVLSAFIPHRAQMLLLFAGHLRAAIARLVSMLRHPFATHVRA